VEFLDEIPALSSRLQSLEELHFTVITIHFSQSNSPPPPGVYMIGPDMVDLENLMRVVSAAHLDHVIAIYFLGISLPYLILVNFFYRFFPPSSVTVHKI